MCHTFDVTLRPKKISVKYAIEIIKNKSILLCFKKFYKSDF